MKLLRYIERMTFLQLWGTSSALAALVWVYKALQATSGYRAEAWGTVMAISAWSLIVLLVDSALAARR